MPLRVLIVDDDVAFREAVRKLLIERGYDVIGDAGTLAQARVAIAELDPDALLLDVNLPDGDGASFSRELSSSGNGARILLTSSDSTAAPRRLVERSGAAGFIGKTELIGADLTPYLG
jgi:DNA-binding NarL/FixJ family response regulator